MTFVRLRAARAALRAHPHFRWMALVVVASGMMLSVVNVSIVNIALPSMAADLGADVPTIGWVVTGFLVTQATLLPVAGRAGDLYGRRRVFVAGVAVLSIASILCALAPSAPYLIAFRILQGVGACAMAPTAFAYAAELFRPAERGQAMGVMGGVIGLAPVLALNVAGLLVEAAGWRSVFWFSPIMGVLVLAAAALVLPPSRRAAGPQRFDLPGAALAAVGLFGLLVALSRGGDWGWGSARTVGAGTAGVVALFAFVARERRTVHPMLDLALFRLSSLRSANLAAGAAAAALFGTLILLPFFLSETLGYQPIRLGLAITPIALSFVIVAPLAGRALARVGAQRMGVLGFSVASAGTLAMALAAPAERYDALLPGIVGLGVGLAMTTSAVTTTAIQDVPPARLGVAAALPSISRYTGGALGTAILGAVLHAGGGLRGAMLVATGFMVLAVLLASRMPRGAPVAPAGAARRAPVGAVAPRPAAE
jgi:EmrB/QacA subfamily drug resistance transporter